MFLAHFKSIRLPWLSCHIGYAATCSTIQTHIHLHTHTYTPTHTHLHTYTHTYTHTSTHLHTHIYTPTHTHTYTHTHTLTPCIMSNMMLYGVIIIRMMYEHSDRVKCKIACMYIRTLSIGKVSLRCLCYSAVNFTYMPMYY